jgi:CYTH domain-containing protein/predicted ATPase
LKGSGILSKNIRKIVFTGGPGGGKTSIIPHARKHLQLLGWHVIIVREIATIFDDAGIGPSEVIKDLDSAMAFQVEVLANQIRQEESSEALAKLLPEDNIAILCDRGLCDPIAYVGEANFEHLIQEVHIGSISEAKNRYDAVIHMVTTADGAEQFYVNKDIDPNSPRAETIEQAREKDELTKQAWLGHAHMAIVDNSTDFDDKVRRALTALSGFLGLPEPFEIERKFLIHMPALKDLYSPDFRQFLISQSYLYNEDAEAEERIRLEVGEGGVHYTHTIKIGKGLVRVEKEAAIYNREYYELQSRLDYSRHTVIKTRYRMLYQNQVIEIDLYPQWTEHAILEVELRSQDDPITLPDFIVPVREVTGEGKFSNYAMSIQMPVL